MAVSSSPRAPLRRLEGRGCCSQVRVVFQASRLKRGRRSGRESSEGGGEEDGSEFESTSEQKDPDREVSPDELSWPGRLLVAADMLKYLLSCLTAPSMSACCCWGKFQVGSTS